MTKIGAINLDDHLIEKTVQGIGSVDLQSFVKPANQLGLSPISSISPTAPQFSPILMPPKQNIMIKVLQAHHETERLTAIRTKNFEADSAKAMAEVDRLSSEREEAFRKEIESAKSRDSWSTLSKVGQYIASVSTVTLGITMAGTSGIIPGLLIGISGVAGGAIRFFNDTQLMQPILEWFTKSEELQLSIQQNIDMGAMYLQMGLGLAGGAAAWHAGSFATLQAANAVEYLTRASSYLTTASTMMNVTSRVGEAYHNKHFADFSAQGKILDLGIHENKHELTHLTKEIGEMIEANDSQVEQIRKAIQRQEVEIG